MTRRSAAPARIARVIVCPACGSGVIVPFDHSLQCPCGRLEATKFGTWWFGSSPQDADMSAEVDRRGTFFAQRDGAPLDLRGRARARFVRALVRAAVVDAVMSS